MTAPSTAPAAAQAEPLGAVLAPPLGARNSESQYFAEEIRRVVSELYGTQALFDGGLSIRSTIDPELQRAAQVAFRKHLAEYDRRHGWRGPLATIELPDDLSARDEEVEVETGKAPFLWETALRAAGEDIFAKRIASEDLEPWKLSVVLEASSDTATIGFRDGSKGTIALSELEWAREYADADHRGREISKVTDVLNPGDVVYASRIGGDAEEGEAESADVAAYSLEQIPAVNGGMVAMDPHTGRVLAMVGGFSFGMSEYNRATRRGASRDRPSNPSSTLRRSMRGTRRHLSCSTRPSWRRPLAITGGSRATMSLGGSMANRRSGWGSKSHGTR